LDNQGDQMNDNKINLSLPCEISEDENNITFRGIKVAKFVEGSIETNCDECMLSDVELEACDGVPCRWCNRKDKLNGHWVAVKKNAECKHRHNDCNMICVSSSCNGYEPADDAGKERK